MIPVFIPVEKKDLANQIQAATVLHTAVQTRDLASIMALPGIRFHPPRSGKDIITRWTSVETEPVPATDAEVEAAEQHIADEAAESDEHHAALDDAEAVEADDADAVTTKGRRRSA